MSIIMKLELYARRMCTVLPIKLSNVANYYLLELHY